MNGMQFNRSYSSFLLLVCIGRVELQFIVTHSVRRYSTIRNKEKNIKSTQKILMLNIFLLLFLSADESDSGIGLCGWLLTAISWGLVAVTLPFSLCVCFKVRHRILLLNITS